MLIGQTASVVGAGIAGLTVALALAQRGAKVTVYEQASEITEVGSGIQISPNGVAVLDALGLGETIRAKAMRNTAVSLRDFRDGRQVLRLDLQRHSPDQTFLLFHRRDLIDILHDAAVQAGVMIKLGHAVSEVADTPTGAVLAFQGQASDELGLVIGADGLHSKLRQHLNGPQVPFFTGQVAWRATIPADGRDLVESTVYMGPGQHVVTYPLRGGSLLNIVAIQERENWAEEGWALSGSPDEMRQVFSAFGEPVSTLLARVTSVNQWGLFRHLVADKWHGQHCVLIGDAAHPTLPFLAQGANLALEDAWVLTDCLASNGLPDAFAAFQARRHDRVVQVIEAANKNARNYHLRHPVGRTLAHSALRAGGLIAPKRILAKYDWIYRHDVTAGEDVR